jgi:SAM-dependent methyltransferase
MNDKDLVKSKPWNWSLAQEEYWRTPSDELYPVAFRWRDIGYKKVLDLGCGVGRNSIFLSQMGFEVDAFDLSPTAIEELTGKIERLKLKIRTKMGDMLELPYANEYFDSILAFHSIYHTDMQGLQNVIREMKRVLVDGGEIFFTLNSKRSPSLKNPKNKIIDEHTILKTEGLEKDIPHTFVDYDEIKMMLEGFQIIKIQQIEDIFEDISSWHYFILIKK